MNTQSVALQLRDIHLPDPVSFWPLAPGWWLLGIILIVLIVLIFAMIRRYERRQIQRLASRQLQEMETQYKLAKDKRKLVADLSVLLRRICLSYYPKQQSAHLTGHSWLLFLDNMVGDTIFRSEPGSVIASAPYQAQADFDAERLLALCAKWIKQLPAHPAKVTT